jgi:hypothetical protein
MKNLIFALAILLVSFSVFAKKCEECQAFEKMSQADFKSKETVKTAQDILMNFEPSKDAQKRSMQIQSYLKLAVKAVQADGSSTSDEYFYNVYELNQKDFDAEIKKLKLADKKIIEKSLKNIAELRKTDDSK